MNQPVSPEQFLQQAQAPVQPQAAPPLQQFAVTLGEDVYGITPMAAYPAYALGLEIVEMLLPTLGAGADQKMNEDSMFSEESEMFTSLSAYLSRGFANLPKERIVDQLLAGLTLNGVPADYKNGMHGKASHIAELVEASLKENLSDFFIEYVKKKVTSIPSLIQAVVGQVQATQE